MDKLAKQTPIYYAARRGHIDMCKLLIDKGTDITLLDLSNKTVVEYAKKAKFTELAEYLSSELKKVREANKAAEDPDKKSRRSRDDMIKDNRQPYKIVFCNEKGEVKDVS